MEAFSNDILCVWRLFSLPSTQNQLRRCLTANVLSKSCSYFFIIILGYCLNLFLICEVFAQNISFISAKSAILNRNKLILIQNRPDFSVENVAGPTGKALPLKVIVNPSILSTDIIRDVPFVIFDGIPEEFRLSEGSKKSHSWIVPVEKLSRLTLFPSATYEGDFIVRTMLYDGKDVRPNLQTFSVAIHPENSVQKPTATGTTKPEPAPLPSVPPKEEELLLKKGRDLLKNGDVSAARLNFENLAMRGSAKGALAMAQSFDPVFLNGIPIRGLKPDLSKAKEWYAKAASLGSKEAIDRLTMLNSGEIIPSAEGQPTQ